jgi:pantoate--beta-alanine ligase
MKVVETIREVREEIAKARKEGKKVGFVPTMGFLHEGHLSLVEESKKHSNFQVMSIFVNRIQFNDPKDFDNYPIDLESDYALAEKAGVDLIFVPGENEMYTDRLTFVDVELLTDNLCGAHRPGHFQGVFTVVSKLFNIVQPDVAVFGQKDIQQAASLHKMVIDLDFPINLIVASIIRESDGLAMSSRNKHLSSDERQRALALSQSIKKAEGMIKVGERNFSKIESEMRKIIDFVNPTAVDYISMVNYKDLQFSETISEKSVIAVAVYFGNTRLIDNMIIDVADNFNCIY